MIRRAEARDTDAVSALVAGAYTPFIARIGREPGPMLDDYARLIADGLVHVLEPDGVIKGVVVLVAEAEAMLLDNVAVRVDAQGLGLGRVLLEFAERRAAEAGFRSIRLYTNAAMTENIALYARLGYVETHRGEERGFRRVYMTKPL